MKSRIVIGVLYLLPFLVTCQTIDLNDYYGYYIGISSQDIKSQSDIKYYMLLKLDKNFCGIDFKEPDGVSFIGLGPGLIGEYWPYKCEVSIDARRQVQIQSNKFFFSLKPIDSLTLKVENSSFEFYIGDTLYRVTALRYKGNQHCYGWTYFPVFSMGMEDDIWRLSRYINYPSKPVWYFFVSHSFIEDTSFSHPLTRKIRRKVANLTTSPQKF